MDEKERDGEEDENNVEDDERICEIRGTASLIGLGGPCIGEFTCRIGTFTCDNGDGTLTCTRNSLKSQFLMMISPVRSDLSLSCPQFYHHLRT